MSSADAGFSPAPLAVLDRVLRETYVDSGQLPGLLTQVWRRGELAHQSMCGLMDIARGTPMRDDAIFRLYSMTKLVTAVALLILVEEGRIDLADEVATYIPSWRNLRVFAGGALGSFETVPTQRPMTVIDLATHTAGLTYGWLKQNPVDAAYEKLNVAASDTPGGLEAFVEQLSGLPLLFSPGEAWNYSVAIDVLAYLVQKVSGQSFGEFLRSRIFEPLGLGDTSHFCPPASLGRLASCYQPGPDGSLVLQDDAAHSSFAVAPKLEAGGHGLVSTVTDYMRLCRMLLGRGSLDGVQILSPKTVEMFSLNYLPGGRQLIELDRNPGPEAWGMGRGMSIACGVTMDVAALRMPGTIGEFCWSGAAATHFWVDPKEDLAVVFMTQVMDSPHFNSMQKLLRTLVYSAFTESYA